MNIKSFPNNQDEYVGAEHLMRWFHGRTSGVWGAEENDALELRQMGCEYVQSFLFGRPSHRKQQ